MISLKYDPNTGAGAILFDNEGHATMALLMQRAINTLSNTPSDVLQVADELARTVQCPE
jgi:hypothetical protein